MNPKVVCLARLACHEGVRDTLLEHGVPPDFDLYSVDVDGCDYHIWKATCVAGDFRPKVANPDPNLNPDPDPDPNPDPAKPKVVCIEFNPTISTSVHFVQEAEVSLQQGSSLLALRDLGKELGYTLLATTTFNGIFVRDDLVHRIDPHLLPRTHELSVMHQTTMVTHLFQTYDGELKFAGPLKMMWHEHALNPQKLQVLSKKNRYFPHSPPVSDRLQEAIAAVNMVESCDWGEGSSAMVVAAIGVISELLIPQYSRGIACALLDRLGGIVLEEMLCCSAGTKHDDNDRCPDEKQKEGEEVEAAPLRDDDDGGLLAACIAAIVECLRGRAAGFGPPDSAAARDLLVRASLLSHLSLSMATRPAPSTGDDHGTAAATTAVSGTPADASVFRVSSPDDHMNGIDEQLVAAMKNTGEDGAWHLASLLELLTIQEDASRVRQCRRIVGRLRHSADAMIQGS